MVRLTDSSNFDVLLKIILLAMDVFDVELVKDASSEQSVLSSIMMKHKQQQQQNKKKN